MPHISSEPLAKQQVHQLNKNFVRILASTVSHTREQALSELLTRTERLMIAKRLGMLLLISKGESSYHIGRKLRMSTSTVRRFEVKVEAGAFDKTLALFKKKEHKNAFISLLVELAAVPFEVERRRRRVRKA